MAIAPYGEGFGSVRRDGYYMKILALDTTENTVSAAVCEEEMPLSYCTLSATRTHSEMLLPMIESMLSGLHLRHEDIDLYACSAGPGSFTGVRIGVATVKGLAFGRGKPCVGVSALEALAWNLAGFRGLICPGMDARRGQLYQALFKGDGVSIRRMTEDRVVTADMLARELAERTDDLPVYFCGGGYDLMLEACAGNQAVSHTPPLLRRENACSVARCAFLHYKENVSFATDDRGLLPLYLRDSQAEREKKARDAAFGEEKQ